jgi:hypothetical protein
VQSNHKRRALAIVLLATCGAAPRQRAATSRDLGNWTSLVYSVSGGIAFNVHSVTMTSDGFLTAADRRLGMDVRGRADPDGLSRLNALLRIARDARPTRPMPDAIGTSLTVTAAGRTYGIEPTPEIASTLESAWKDAIAHAIVGSWTQSGWKPCHPVAQMTSMDVPIDDLALRADGTFSITWLGGGARTTQMPHVTLPDYSGSYTIKPELGAFHVNLPPGVAPPRDFTADGSFQIAQDQLTLKTVWLGTRVAPQRPDICELTFGRKVDRK